MGRIGAKWLLLQLVMARANGEATIEDAIQSQISPFSVSRVLEKRAPMRIKIIVKSLHAGEGHGLDQFKQDVHRMDTCIYEGEWELLAKNEYITKISIIAEGKEHPICDVPFAIDEGYWQWISPMAGASDNSDSDIFGSMGDIPDHPEVDQ